MRVRQESEEVVYATEPVVKVGFQDIAMLKDKAGGSVRQRVRLCAHLSVDDSLHEMFIVHTRDTYIRPHKHLNKSESFHVIEGLVDVVMFDDAGNPKEIVYMGDYLSGRLFYYRLAVPVYHTLLIRSDYLVFHEITRGPFNRADTVFASWSPDPNDRESVARFTQKLTRLTTMNS